MCSWSIFRSVSHGTYLVCDLFDEWYAVCVGDDMECDWHRGVEEDPLQGGDVFSGALQGEGGQFHVKIQT